MKVRIATRGSELALTQVRLVSAALRAHTPDLEVEEVPVSTRGDRVTDRPLAALGGKGLFVSEVEAMVATGATCVAYETLRDEHGRLPLLTPMSEVAGRMSIQEGAKYLEKPQMGRGILLGGVPGVAPAHITILGGGVVGANAAKIAAGFQADVTILDINMDRLRYLDDIMPANVNVLFSDRHVIREELRLADLVVGSVLIPGAKAPNLVRRDDLRLMKPGSVIIDVAIDQGGCVETSRPTSHGDPTFIRSNCSWG